MMWHFGCLCQHILTEFGHSARSAEDGFSALSEIRNEIPDIILSDLNMPRMSGFELLSVVRRRFPVIRVIAMSGTFSGGVVPPGVVADAFYEKGLRLSSLLQIVQDMTHMDRRFFQRPSTLAPIWIPKNGHDPSGEEYVMITCPECLRVFPQVFGKIPLPHQRNRLRSLLQFDSLCNCPAIRSDIGARFSALAYLLHSLHCGLVSRSLAVTCACPK